MMATRTPSGETLNVFTRSMTNFLIRLKLADPMEELESKAKTTSAVVVVGMKTVTEYHYKSTGIYS